MLNRSVFIFLSVLITTSQALSQEQVKASLDLNNLCQTACEGVEDKLKGECLNKCFKDFHDDLNQKNETCSTDTGEISSESETEKKPAFIDFNNNFLKDLRVGLEYTSDNREVSVPLTVFTEVPVLKIKEEGSIFVRLGAGFNKKKEERFLNPEDLNLTSKKNINSRVFTFSLGAKLPLGSIVKVGSFYFNTQGELVSRYSKINEEKNVLDYHIIQVDDGEIIETTPAYSTKKGVEKLKSLETLAKISLSCEFSSKNNLLNGLEVSLGAAYRESTGKLSPFVSISKDIFKTNKKTIEE